MKTYRVQLALRSPLVTPLSADTLLGHLCWGIVYHEGAGRLRAFLAEMDGPEPPLVISDPLPAGHWPMPCLPRPDPQAYQRLLGSVGRAHPAHADDELRGVLRRPLLPHALWDQVAGRLDAAALAECLLREKAPEPPSLRTASVAHNTVNRLTTHTSSQTDEGGPAGGLFFQEQMFPANGRADFDVWVRSAYSEDRIRQLFERGLAGGYGRDAGTGMGHLTVESIEPADLPAVHDANGVMTLGTCAPAQDDPADGVWSIEVRQGKLGGAWAGGQTDDAAFKRPVVLLARGAVFRTSSPRPVMGRMVHDVHPTRPEVVTCGYTLTLPVHLTQEAIPCPATA